MKESKINALMNIILNGLMWLLTIGVVVYRTAFVAIDETVIAYLIVASVWQLNLTLNIFELKIISLKSTIKNKDEEKLL